MKINYFAAALLLALSACMQTKTPVERGGFKTEYITAERILWTDGRVCGTQKLLKPFCGQVAVTEPEVCTMQKGSAVLLDYGRELHGGLRLTTAIRGNKNPVRVRVRLGESVSEAMSDVATSTATNEHSLRDFTLELPWLGSIETGNSGFRFARIDLIEGDNVPFVAIEAKSIIRDLEYLGSFRCSDKRLNEIWNTAAYTVHLNMQDYVWDGIKRDRLVWIGDMHPEVMTINTVFGSQDVVRRSLDFVRDGTGADVWMNGICSYSMWWLIIHRDLFLYTGDLDYLREQHGYMAALLRRIIGSTEGSREAFKEGRFIDWPTSENPESIHQSLQALCVMTMKAGVQIAEAVGDEALRKDCASCLERLQEYVPGIPATKQAASFLSLAGLMDPEAAAGAICDGGAAGFATFTGYYMLEALAQAGRYDEALQIISDYWGGMLDLGATSFWEDLNYADLAKASRIDGFVPEGKYDIHEDGGAYCYEGLRHSLCHGWASGPAPWMSRHILGVAPLEPGFAKVRIEPHLGKLDWAEGSFPTPKGVLTVSVCKDASGRLNVKVKAPKGVKVVK